MFYRTAIVLALFTASTAVNAKPSDQKFHQAAKNKTVAGKNYEVAGSDKEMKDPNELSKLAPAAGTQEKNSKGLNPRQFKMQ